MLAVSRIVGSNPDSNTAGSKFINQLLNKDIPEVFATTECVLAKSNPVPDYDRSGSDMAVYEKAATNGICSPYGDSHQDGLPLDTTSSSSFINLLDSVSLGGLSKGHVTGAGPEMSYEGVLPCIISEDIAVGMEDFLSAAKHVQPTAKREGFAVVPDVSWGKHITCSAFSNLTHLNDILIIKATFL